MKSIKTLLLLLLIVLANTSFSQVRTVGRISYDELRAMPGYTLFTPNQSQKSFLIDNCGRVVHRWNSNHQPGMLAYLREDGLLLRAGRDASNSGFGGLGGNGGYLELINWDNTIIWEYLVSDSTKQAHHDIEPLPNGNILVVAWEKIKHDEAKNAGRDTSLIIDGEIWAEAIYEIKPILPDSGIIAWEWHIKDHLIQNFDSSKANYGNILDHPELMDLNFVGSSNGGKDWLHANSIAYNPIRDEIIMSLREMNEFIVIDHSTTTGLAAGHTGGNSGKGGDIIYRWGNPMTYGRAGTQQLFHQHDARWVEPGLANEGQIQVFNNGDLRPTTSYSSVDFLEPALDSNGRYLPPALNGYLPLLPSRSFSSLPSDTIYSAIMGGAQVLPNGNILATQSVHGRFAEFDTSGNLVWEYINPTLALDIFLAQGTPVPVLPNSWANAVFRSQKYDVSFPGFGGVVLIPGDYLESFPYPDSCYSPISTLELSKEEFVIGPNPAHDFLQITRPNQKSQNWVLRDVHGKICANGILSTAKTKIDVKNLPSGIYIIQIGENYSRKVIVQK